jgi:protein-tyrosine phosphatase
MLNIRKIDKFWLSGGWQDLDEDIKFLKENKFRAVLDLQFTYYDEVNTADIQEMLDTIEYKAIPMMDGDGNNLREIFQEGYDFLIDADSFYTEKKDKILVKCGAGVSRSSAMLIAYFCESRRMSFREAKNYVRVQEDKDWNMQWHADPAPIFQFFLRNKYPESSVFGEKE